MPSKRGFDAAVATETKPDPVAAAVDPVADTSEVQVASSTLSLLSPRARAPLPSASPLTVIPMLQHNLVTQRLQEGNGYG